MKEMNDSDRNEHLGPTHWHVGNSGTDYPAQYFVPLHKKSNVGVALIALLYLLVGAATFRVIFEIF